MSRTLDSIATTTGELPAHLWLQSDNTTAQSKNSSSHLCCALLVGRRQMSTVTCSYLTKGHTHEDVDHFFGELLPILRRNHFECLEDMQQLLQKELQVRAENCQEQLQVETMTAIHDFTGWMDVTGVRLMNRSRKKQPQERCAIPAHSFTYKRREDLSASEREQLPASTAQGHAQDVFAIIKARMHHGHDQAKPPVLTLPWDRASRVGAFSQVPTLPPNDIAEDKKKNISHWQLCWKRSPTTTSVVHKLCGSLPGTSASLSSGPSLGWMCLEHSRVPTCCSLEITTTQSLQRLRGQ